mgnify:FL=1
MMMRKILAIALSVGMVCLVLGGCGSAPKPSDPAADAPSIPSSTPQPQVSEPPADEKAVSLFDTLFVPAAQGNIPANVDALKQAAAAHGFHCIEEAGVVLILDPKAPDCCLRCEPVFHDEVPLVGRLVYSRSMGDFERQVTAAGMDAGQTLYFIGANQLYDGTQVSSLEEVKAYLTAEITPEETSLGNPETALDLFDNVLAPLVEGTLPNRADAFMKVLEQYGYIYKDGEGLFTVYDPSHPGNYLFGSNALYADTDTISTLGFHLETETDTKEVEVFFYTGAAQYYICHEDFSREELSSFQQMRQYLTQE